MILVTRQARAGRFALARRVARRAVLDVGHQYVRSPRALPRAGVARLAGAVRLAVREAGVLDPARAQHGARGHEPSLDRRQLVAGRALRLDDVLRADDGALPRRARHRPRREDAPHFLGVLPRQAAVARVNPAEEAVDDPRIAAVRHLGVRKTRIEREAVAAPAVARERDRLRVELP